jgi:serine beta-lactamase-like protein LACTB, mitochondrial
MTIRDDDKTPCEGCAAPQMSRYFIFVVQAVSVIVSLAVISQGAGAQRAGVASRQEQKPHAVAPLGAATTARLDHMFNAFVSQEHIPGLAVAVARDGFVVWDKAYGQADLENEIPVTSRTLFRIGSIAKTITAVAILQLAGRGTINLDTSVENYVPAFPRKRFPVTVAGLLTGTSGIRGYIGDEYLSNHHYPSLAASLTMFQNDSLAYEPGTSYVETPFGYTLLGLALNAVTGVSYEEYLSRNVFAPADMADTKVDVPAQIIRNRARLYTRDSTGTIRNADAIDPSYKIPAGGWLSTAKDVARFGLALGDGALLSPDSYARLTKAVRLNNGTELPLGMGVALGTVGGRLPARDDAIWSTGLQQGGTAVLLMYPRDRIVVAILMNVNGEVGAAGFGLLTRTTAAAESTSVLLRQVSRQR